MKFKSFAMLAICGILASSLACSMTAFAEDQSENNDAAAAVQPQQANPADNMPSSVAQNNDSAGPDSAVNTEQATPDTATGDDDY